MWIFRPKKYVQIYWRRGSFLICPFNGTISRWFADEHVIVVNDRDEATMGNCVREAFARSRANAKMPGPEVDLEKPFYEAAKVKSWSTFVKGSKLVDVYVDKSMFITPCRNRGGREGFVGMLEERIEIPRRASALQLGTAILAAFDIATDGKWRPRAPIEPK
jgi:hypothetical protein